MVWFQCEDCGENLKKPKLPNHFRICSAFKLSCIDCGEIFGQETVQAHNQCITEAEKYGPKGQGKASNGVTPKPKNDAKQRPEVDINVGLSDRPPWFCSLCNTKATSKQTLLLHADGKKHRAKARAFHAANQPSNQVEESAPDSNVVSENAVKGELQESKHLEEQKEAGCEFTKSEVENGDVSSKKKRKHDLSVVEGKTGDDATDKESNSVKAEETESRLKKAKHNAVEDDKAIKSDNLKEETKSVKIKWRKLIKSALKTNPDGVLKMRKLKKLVLKSIHESGVTEDETQLGDKLEQMINSNTRFRVEGKYVHLITKD